MPEVALTDADLLLRFRAAGDREALALLAERHRGLAYRVAFSVLGDAADAEDATQDALLNLLAYEPRVRPEGPLSGLVACMALRAAQRLARSAGRRRARENAWGQEAIAAPADPSSIVEARALRDVVRAAVNTLGETYRLPVVLHYLEGMSIEQTAGALGISPGATRTRLSRAVGKLRRHLGETARVWGPAALVALLRPHAAEAESLSLRARLEQTVANAPYPVGGAAPVAGVATGVLQAKLIAAGLVVVTSLCGIGTLRRLPPPPQAGAALLLQGTPGTSPAARAGPGAGTVAVWPGVAGAALPGARPRGGATAGRSEPAPGALPRPGSPKRAITPPSRLSEAAAVPRDQRPPPPVPTIRRLTPEEERRLAVEVLTQVWQESEKAEYWLRLELLVPLAMVDAARAEQLAATAAPRDRDRALACVLAGRFRAGSGDLPELANPAMLAGLTQGELTLLSHQMERLAARNPARARALLDPGLAAARREGTPWLRATGLAWLAALAVRVGDARAPQLLDEAARLMPEVVKSGPGNLRAGRWGEARSVLEGVGAADPDLALRLLEQIPDARDRETVLIQVAARGIRRRDPARARALLEAHRPEADDTPGSFQSGYAWDVAARQVAADLAPKDAAAAEELARHIAFASERARALAAVAGSVGSERASALRNEAVEEACKYPGEGGIRDLARLAPELPVGPERRRACVLALEMQVTPERHSSDTGLVPWLAFSLAPVDPVAAILVLEDTLAVCPTGENGARLRATVALAMVAADPARAAAIARQIPAAPGQLRFDTLRRIGQYLAADPQVRVTIPLEAWESEGHWAPGDETPW